MKQFQQYSRFTSVPTIMVAWSSYIFGHPVALLALAAKLAGITFWSAVVARRIPDRLTSWLQAWLGVQALEICALLLLSAFSALSRTSVWVCILALLGSGLIAYAGWGHKFGRPSLKSVGWFALLALPLILWALRCVIIPDFTNDAQAYGTVRIALWMNYRSVFVHMPTEMVNIFADEWNGELNGLVYAFATGNIQGSVMGNAEILILATIASIWAARRFGAGETGSALVGLLMATSPAFVGLAAVTKGDLLACVGTMLAVGMLERPTAKSICFAAIWFALAAGSKIAVLPGAAIILGFVLITRARLFYDRRPLAMLIAAGVPSALFMGRFVANTISYGHPFVRVNAEAAEPGINTLIGNMALIGERFVGFFPVSPIGIMYSTSLAAGLGVCGWIAAFGAASGRLRLPGTHTMLALLCSVSVGATAFLIPPRLWGFRYFLPFIAPLAVAALVAATQAADMLPRTFRSLAIVVAIGAAVFDYAMCFTPGDISSPQDFRHAMNASIRKSPLERAMIQFPTLVDEANPYALGLDSGTPKKIAILNEISSMILVFQGSGGQNRLYLADTTDGLRSTALSHRVDYVVLARSPNGSKLHPFDIPGYKWIWSGNAYDIAARR
ncbi:hypothetical protein KZJ38_16215 [Paraburkholderia edwinii]|uniref:Dolichyl-phosphate-mannose-protein mannosyltransferase n=1 Tax=Paraburkholderia edwinii TaxID=2861782 RepID=A0ABX8ULL9_9BURK|nr:hypothetical protein [Paraburkholderia edwinii]QYD67853.1 hypothetical protein KZJ38_16215 [Paraburkholderia edwinii]